jgi:pimeloyl-ACP methyl ester carboxylesterase
MAPHATTIALCMITSITGVISCTTPSELSDPAVCLGVLGTADLAPYQSHALSLPSLYGRPAATRIFLPLYSSWPLYVKNVTIKRAVIFQHGLFADANSYFCDGIASALAAQSAPGSTLVVAPWFGNVSVSGQCWGSGGLAGDASLFFNTDRWVYGGDNSPGPAGNNPPTRFTTSFDALDALISALLNTTTYPALESVIIAGFSAGAQLAQRYAWAARSLPPGVSVIVSDPSSYVYFDPYRPAPSCRPLRDTGTSLTCDAWSVPPEAATCPG